MLRDSMIKSIDINPDWFYHRMQLEKLEDILNTGAILSRRKLGYQKMNHTTWNGLDYISLSKREEELIWNSSYNRFISSSYAFVLGSIPAEKTEYIEDNNYELWRKLSKLLPNKRFSPYEDEYQVKDEISLDTVVGIKIPDRDKKFSSVEYYKEKDWAIDVVLKKLGSNLESVPFVDVNEGLQIDRCDIKKYMKNRKGE